MKKKVFSTAIATLLCIAAAKAQFILGAGASYLTGENAKIWGGGVQAKFMLADRIAIGATVKAFPKNYQEVNIGSGTVHRYGNAVVPVTGMFEYYFGKDNDVQPYLGADAGLCFNKVFSQFTTGNTVIANQETQKTYFGAAPKAGLMIKTGGLFALFAQAQYTFLFGSGDNNNITVPGFGSSIESKPADKFATFDAGILIRLKAAGK